MYVALLVTTAAVAQLPQPITRAEDLLVTSNAPGKYGGRIVIALRAEPKSLNPVTSLDQPSREVIGRMMADLLHINAISQQAEPALAKSWKVSKDGLVYSLTLRRGLRFSDGQPMNADDVLFTFQVLLDEKINSPQRDLLTIGGKPIAVRKVDDATVVFELARPYAAAERLFDSMEILPRHLLQDAYRQGTLARAWSLTTPASQIAGMGPFRLKEYQPGQKLVLERNPYYWKADRNHQRLPYLDELVFLFVPSEDAQVLRFEGGETDLLQRLSADNYAALQKDAVSRNFHLFDLGPSLDYNFLVFNLNATIPKDATDIARHQEWFRNVNFRQAVSAAVDRAAIVRLVFHGRGTALWSSVTPANKLWLDGSLPQAPRSVEHAKQLLRNGGFTWNAQGTLLDKSGAPVEFSILTSASNAQRTQMATLIQDDLRQLGMKVQAVPLEFKSMLDRVFQTHNYDTAIMALGGGDVDPNSQINVWMSDGGSHLWNLGESKPATEWEAQIDTLMNQQLSTLDYKRRKQLYDRVQEIAAQQLPFINLASPNVLVGARERIGNFQPAILDHYTLWNVEQLYVK
ncbi:MAG TPA: ABC transporter substrate-binding protein [Candidatus Angelobacter sp.]|nr:ABC transporter substrate-binding protein [Candidatus Angelobacter sp.]